MTKDEDDLTRVVSHPSAAHGDLPRPATYPPGRKDRKYWNTIHRFAALMEAAGDNERRAWINWLTDKFGSLR